MIWRFGKTGRIVCKKEGEIHLGHLGHHGAPTLAVELDDQVGRRQGDAHRDQAGPA